MKNDAITNIKFAKTMIADLTKQQGTTMQSWSSIALNAIKQQTLANQK
ncbi:hypothetical protein [Kordia sp.]|nr:hypothetical protein [Kordia sp.]MCH2195487.1 hypothetical protein [Kordia sp.]